MPQHISNIKTALPPPHLPPHLGSVWSRRSHKNLCEVRRVKIVIIEINCFKRLKVEHLHSHNTETTDRCSE